MKRNKYKKLTKHIIMAVLPIKLGNSRYEVTVEEERVAIARFNHRLEIKILDNGDYDIKLTDAAYPKRQLSVIISMKGLSAEVEHQIISNK
jgi:hypothetical protein